MILYEYVNTRVSKLPEISSRILANQKEPSSTVFEKTQTYNNNFTDYFTLTSEPNRRVINLTRTWVNNNMTSSTTGHVTVKTADFPHNQIMLLILLAIFTTISVSISVAVLVFCRKKNTVFMLQKCEQESDVEMDDLPTEIDNSDTDSEEIRTVIRKSESYPALSKYSRKSYPSLLKNSSAKKIDIPSTFTEKCTLHSASLMPLLENSERSDHTNVATDSVKRTNNTNFRKSKTIHKCKTFPSPHECHSLLETPGLLLNKECSFGSISSTVSPNKDQKGDTFNGIQVLKTKRKYCSYTRTADDSMDEQKDDSVLTPIDNHLEFHGKVEII